MAKERVGLVLAGGGARGAYEIGALSVLLPWLEQRGESPRVVVGTSVGAINAAFVGASAHLGAEEAMRRAREAWLSIEFEQVVRPLLGPRTVFSGARYVGEVLGVKGVQLNGLLDPLPLSRTLERLVNWRHLHANLDRRRRGEVRGLDAVAVVATSAASSRSVVFVEGARAPATDRSRGIEYAGVRLGAEHVMASAAIPLVFPAVAVTRPARRRGWYFDGGTRLNTPIKPALALGVDRVVVIGLNSVATGATTGARDRRPDFVDGALQLLHATLVDPVAHDIETLHTINRRTAGSSGTGFRRIPYVFVTPGRGDVVGQAAMDVYKRHYDGLLDLVSSPDLWLLGRLFGGGGPIHGEALSYLFFAPEFAARLIELGAADAKRWLRRREPWAS
jgi:NTE family protein